MSEARKTSQAWAPRCPCLFTSLLFFPTSGCPLGHPENPSCFLLSRRRDTNRKGRQFTHVGQSPGKEIPKAQLPEISAPREEWARPALFWASEQKSEGRRDRELPGLPRKEKDALDWNLPVMVWWHVPKCQQSHPGLHGPFHSCKVVRAYQHPRGMRNHSGKQQHPPIILHHPPGQRASRPLGLVFSP